MTCAATCAVVAQDTAPNSAAVIRGRVTETGAGIAIRGARLVLLRDGTSTALVTDDNGAFVFPSVANASRLTLRVTKAGYAGSVMTLANGARGDLVIELSKAAAVVGQIIDSSGAPAAGLTVRSRPIAPAPAQNTPPLTIAVTDSDDLGEYRLGGLAAGRYEIDVVRMPGPGPLEAVSAAAAITAASTIQVRAGDEVGLDFTVTDPSTPCGPRLSTSPVTAGTSRISGRVVAATGEPLRCATVRIAARGGPAWTTTTDASGRFRLGDLPAGSFSVEASHAGHLSRQFGQRRSTDVGTDVVLRSQEEQSRVDIVLPRGSSLSGTIVDEHREPIEGMYVRTLQLRTIDGRTVVVTTPGVAARRTDDHGRYRLFGVLPGSYLVVASDDGARPGDVVPLGSYAPTFYPGTPDVSAASRIAIEPGNDVAGIDFARLPSKTSTVSGSAVDADGQPFRGALLLSISQRSGAIVTEPRMVPVRADGVFTITGVPPGDYALQALKPNGDDRQFGMQYVTVGDSDPAPIKLRTARGGSLEGRVIVEGGERLDSRSLLAFPFPTDFDRSPIIGDGPTGTSLLPDGTLRVVAVTGPRRFTLMTAPENWYLKSARVGSADALDVPFDFGLESHTYPDVEIVVSPFGAAVQGNIAYEGDVRPGNVAVVVFSSHSDLWFRNSRHVKWSRAAADGTFVVAGLPPGDYFVAAIPGSESDGPTQWQNPEMLERASAAAQRVTLAEKERRHITLRPGQ